MNTNEPITHNRKVKIPGKPIPRTVVVVNRALGSSSSQRFQHELLAVNAGAGTGLGYLWVITMEYGLQL